MYDKAADRFFMAQFGGTGDNGIYIAISQTPDPTGAWYVYTFTSPDFPDYLKFSTWVDGYYMTANYAEKVFAFNRTKMLAGDPTAEAVYKTFAPPVSGFFVPMPGDVSDTGIMPAAGSPCPIFCYQDDGWASATTDAMNIYQMSVNWTTLISTVTLAANLPLNAFDASYDASWNDISQPTTTQKLDGIGGAMWFRSQFRKWSGYNTVLCSWGVKISATQRGIFWMELRQDQGTGTWSVFQQGIYAPGTDSYWMGSLAMNNAGDIGMAYAVGSSARTMSVGYTGRLSCDPLGTMPIPQTIAQAGTGYQTTLNRVGDYSQTVLDPDGMTFWFTGEYIYQAASYGSADTRIISFQLPGACAAPSNIVAETVTIYKDRGKQITVTGDDIIGCSFDVGGIACSVISNDGSTAVINIPAGNYSSGTLTVTNASGSGSDNTHITAASRTTIPVDAATGANTDIHPTIDSATDGLHAWLGATAFTADYIIDVAAGTYAESVTMNPALNPTSTNTLTIQNNSATAPTVNATGFDYGFDLSTVDYVTLTGFDIYGANLANVNVQGDNNTVVYNKVRDAVAGAGIKVQTGGTNTIKNNLATGNYSYGIHNVSSNSNTFKNNTCDNNGDLLAPPQDVVLFYDNFEADPVTNWPAYAWTWFDVTADPTLYVSAVSAMGVTNSTEIMTSANIDISGYTNIEIECYVRAYGTPDAADYVRGEYSLDGAAYVQFFNQVGNSTAWPYVIKTVGPLAVSNSTLNIRFTAKSGNSEYWLLDDVTVRGDENTAAGPIGSELYVQSGTGNILQNNILVAKSGDDAYYALKTAAGVTVTSSYNTYYSTNTNIFDYNGAQNNTGPAGTGDLTSDPQFVTAGSDFHLKSTIGSYKSSKAQIWPPTLAAGGAWSVDLTDSPSLSGNPADSYTNEPEDNGDVINRGVFGGTTQASKGPPLPCTYPFTQASGVSAAVASSTSLDVSWTRGDGDFIIIVAHSGAAVNSDPVDGTTYTANAAFGSGTQIGTGNYVVYIGTGTTIEVTGLTTGTTYHFAAYEFTDADKCYLVPGVTANGTPTASAPVITLVSPNSFYADKGKQIVIDGTDLGSATSVSVAGVAGTIDANSATQITVTFPEGLYINNTLTVTTGAGSDTETCTVNTRNTIPVDATAAANDDTHQTIQSALNGLFAWFGTSAFNTATAGYLSGTKIIDVYDGTYTQTVTPNVTLGTTASESLIIQNHTGEQPAINAAGNTNGVYIGDLDYVTFTGFTVYGATGDNIYSEGDNNTFTYNKV